MDWGPPPGPPADDWPGAEPGNENEIPPTPETIVYDPTESSGEVICTVTNPDTGEPIDARFASDQIEVIFVQQATIKDIDSALAAIGGWKKMNVQATGVWVAGIEPVSTCAELQAKIDQLMTNPLVVSVEKVPLAELSMSRP